MTIDLEEETEEFQQVSKLFRVSPSGGIPDDEGTIIRIVRIQNTWLWAQYCRKKQEMQQAQGGGIVAERKLFHGTAPENVDSICRRGFEIDRPSVHGLALGRGIYFAIYKGLAHDFTFNRSATPCKPEATYSPWDGDEADSARQSSGPGSSTATSQDEDKRFRHYMLLSSVLVGVPVSVVPVDTVGSQAVRILPPPLTPPCLRLDSYRAGTDMLGQFVIFDNHQAYPEYVIEYYTV